MTQSQIPQLPTIQNIIKRIHSHAMTMIFLANERDDVEKGDPKVGGHPSASSSALHLLTTLHLITKTANDYIACKPHASPTDHASNYLLRLFTEADGSKMNDERARTAMKNLRHFSWTGEPVFQSSHSEIDPDRWGYLPSGSVGIPPVNAAYLAHAYRMAKTHGYKIPENAQFWCIMGDSEYREGSLAEVLPEAAERGLGNLTWIVDYNRQSLDGHRILNEEALGGKDNDRIEKTAAANGWDTMQLRHGRFREEIFAKFGNDGEALRHVLESAVPDYEFNSLVAKRDPKAIIEALGKCDKAAQKVLSQLSSDDVTRFITDLGGHCIETLVEAYAASKKDPHRPMLLIAHTVKGLGLRCAAQSTNHSAMLEESEVVELRAKIGLTGKDLKAFEHFDDASAEGKFLKTRGTELWNGMEDVKKLRKENLQSVRSIMDSTNATTAFPTEIGINLKLVPLIHTQWMLGQITAKLSRIADTSIVDADVKAPQRPLTAEEKKFKAAARLLISMAPDVGTSTNLNSSMDGRIYGADTEDFEKEYGVKDTKAPDIVPHESDHSRYIRFDIAEGNAMTCVGSYGKMGELMGVPFIPLMTVYDFFIKRALDQMFYNLYWNASFIAVGTPAGITLSPEGAQHAWKSDIQIANMITWEPAYAIELDWIITESVRRHLFSYFEGKDSPNGNAGRTGVLIRGVTRSLEQKEMLKRLKTHKRFAGQSDEAILESTRKDVLEGGWYIVDHRGQPGYRPSENVVNLFAMGSLVTEALAASDALLAEGIFANVIMVSSSDLLLGNLADKNGYRHLKKGLGITGDLYLAVQSGKKESIPNGVEHYPPEYFGPKPLNLGQALTLGGRRIPVVSVHDGEPGLIDNIGSVVGTIQKTLAVRKHSKSGRPSDVFKYHGVDRDSLVKVCKAALEESAYSNIQVDASVAGSLPANPGLNA